VSFFTTKKAALFCGAIGESVKYYVNGYVNGYVKSAFVENASVTSG